MSLRLTSLLLLLGCLVAFVALPGYGDNPAPRKVAGFNLKDPRDQKTVALADLKDKKAIVVVFLGTECPVSNLFLPVLAKLHEEYSSKGVAFIGINANRQDTLERVAEHAKKNELPFPVVKDIGNKVADDFGAKRTPEAFVMDASGQILYHGRIDDQFGVGFQRSGKPTRRDLAEALDEVLAGKPVATATTPVSGCFIARATPPKADGDITYTKQVSRIIQKNCQACHRPGQIGPMALTTYDDALSWADTIREVVTDQRMPPWHADPKHGKWSNDRSLSKQDRDTLLAWIDGGKVKGDPKDLPPAKEYVETWTIGKPDLVLKMPEPFEVPAETPKGGVPYQYFNVETEFKEDKWIERAEAMPNATAVVHHMVAFVVPPGERFRQDKPGAVLCGTAPGDMPLILEPGHAKKIPAGSRIVLQMHYTPNGKAMTDQSSVGLIFAKNPPQHRVLTHMAAPIPFVTRQEKIPAGDGNYKMEVTYTFPKDGHIIDFMPHMHLRGKDFLFEATYPDGKTEVLLSVPRYDFNWQSVYRAEKPLAMPAGTKLRCLAHFDNSDKNPNNPDASKPVFWGDQTWEEMMVGWFDFYWDEEPMK
jgi:peroxiredoxin/mono/diheme cytochrome c family protein